MTEARPARERWTLLLALLLVLCGFASSGLLFSAAFTMFGMASVSGTSLAESYYNQVGVACAGLAFFAGPLLWALAALASKK